MTYIGNIVEDFDITAYPSDPKAIVVMLGLNNDSLCDISKIKTLLNSIKTKYTGKYIFVADELPVGINYVTTDYTYEQLNSQIKNYNNSLQKITGELGLKSITVQGGMVENDILASHYTYNGLDLNVVGCKMLLNNIKYQIKNNVGTFIPPDDEDSGINGVNPLRQKIMEKAEEIVRMCVNHKANYSQRYRTISYKAPNTIKSRTEYVGNQLFYQPSWVVLNQTIGYDCSSFTGVCYEYAGIEYLKGLSCSAGSLQTVCKNHGAEFWRYTGQESVDKLKEGDIIMVANYNVTDLNMTTVSTHHVMISGGGNTVLHASGFTSGILKQKVNFTNKHFFIRIKEVAEADNSNNITNPSDSEHPNVFYENGTIDGMNYVAKLTHSRCTAYGTPSPVGAGGNLIVGKSCGAHNLPYNTKLYIPSTKKYNGDGIWYVKDTGGYTTDFDLLISKSASEAVKMMGSPLDTDVYILEYGDGKMSWSFTEAIEWCNGYYGVGYFHKSWTYYMKYGGCTINFWKFKDQDKTIKSQPWYDKL